MSVASVEKRVEAGRLMALSPDQQSDEFLTIPGVMHRTKLGRGTVYREIAAGNLKTTRFGKGSVRVSVADYRAWIASKSGEEAA
jgi:predicted DNA-binding transcriptional regulator AlpA